MRRGAEPGLTGAGEEVPAAEHVVGRGCQQILGAAQSAKAKVPGGEHKGPLSFSCEYKIQPPPPLLITHIFHRISFWGVFRFLEGTSNGNTHQEANSWESLGDQWLSGADTISCSDRHKSLKP